MTITHQQLAQRDAQSICHTYGRYPLAVASASGARLRDLQGREYIDLLAGIAVCNLGHCRPELAAVMAEQARKLVHVSNLFFTEGPVLLAEKLLSTCHADKVFFCNSGAEANEAAIKLARRLMRKKLGRDAGEIVTLQGSFHGRTLATVTATGQPRLQDGFAPLPSGFVHAPWGDLPALEALVTDKTAAVMLEVVQGEGGIRVLPQEYAAGVQRLCRERGVLLMVDEVQAGLCRTGKFWAFQHFGLTPDIFTAAKALANGLPMGAMLATEHAAQGFEPGTHATTFGGGAVIAAVALKTLEIMRDENLAQRAADLGAWALRRLGQVQDKHPDKIADVRGLGLMLGVELAFPAQDIWKQLLEKGFICNCTQERVLRLLPPLTIAKEDIEAFARTLDELLA
jgi:acetylornithine/N-succinyldiaminopimelate aminotransferase